MARTRRMRAGAYRRACASSSTIGPTAAGRVGGASAAARTRRVPTITPSAPASPPRRPAPGSPMPNPTATGTSVCAFGAADDRVEARPPRARPSCRRPRPCRRSRGARRRSAPGARRASSAPRAAQRDARSPRTRRGCRPTSSSGRSGTIRPAAPGSASARGEALGAPREHEVGVAHEHHRQPGGERLGDVEHGVDRRPAASARGAGGVDHRAVGERVGERHAELDEVGAVRRRRPRPRRREAAHVREAAHQVGHQRRALARGGERRRDAAPVRRSSRLVERAGPRRGPCRRGPERHTRSMSPPGWRAPTRARARTRAPG